MPGSLAGRMIFGFVGVILVAMLALAAIVPRIERTHQMAFLQERLADEAALVSERVVNEIDQGRAADLDPLIKRLAQLSRTRLTIVTPDGRVIAESDQDLALVGNHSSRPEIQQAFAGNRGVDVHYSETVGSDMLYVAVPIMRNGVLVGVARTALSLREVDRLAGEQTRAILLASLGSGLLALGVAILAARAIGNPLVRLTRLAARFATDPARGGHFPRIRGPQELAQLGEALETLAAAVSISLRRVGEERDRLEALLANLADGIVIVDANGRVARVNQAAEGILAVEAGTGRTIAEVFRDHELIAMVEQVQSSRGMPVATAFFERRHSRRFFQVTASHFGTGDAAQTLVVLHDLTDLRHLETVRRDFIANVSHELRTPISSIKLMTETLQDGAIEDGDAARDFLGRIAQEIDGMHRLVEELLELSRLESGQIRVTLAATDPSLLVHRAVERLSPLARRANISLAAEVPDGLPAILADGERLGEVMVNLIHNAVKFTPPAGSVVVRAVQEDDFVKLSVVDDGAGIAPDLLLRIFERFYKGDKSRAEGGTGLGLAIAKHTVQQHSGRIWAESDGYGRGTAIHVLLPCAEP